MMYRVWMCLPYFPISSSLHPQSLHLSIPPSPHLSVLLLLNWLPQFCFCSSLPLSLSLLPPLPPSSSPVSLFHLWGCVTAIREKICTGCLPKACLSMSVRVCVRVCVCVFVCGLKFPLVQAPQRMGTDLSEDLADINTSPTYNHTVCVCVCVWCVTVVLINSSWKSATSCLCLCLYQVMDLETEIVCPTYKGQ